MIPVRALQGIKLRWWALLPTWSFWRSSMVASWKMLRALSSRGPTWRTGVPWIFWLRKPSILASAGIICAQRCIRWLTWYLDSCHWTLEGTATTVMRIIYARPKRSLKCVTLYICHFTLLCGTLWQLACDGTMGISLDRGKVASFRSCIGQGWMLCARVYSFPCFLDCKSLDFMSTIENYRVGGRFFLKNVLAQADYGHSWVLIFVSKRAVPRAYS